MSPSDNSIKFQFFTGKQKLSELENWVYSTTELEGLLELDDYLKLISLNFAECSALQEAKTILRKYIKHDSFIGMDGDGFWISGELETWPSKSKLAKILTNSGLEVYVGNYSIRVLDCECWSFESVESNAAAINADTDTIERAIEDVRLVSNALAGANIRHRFEVWGDDKLVEKALYYQHHLWPQIK